MPVLVDPRKVLHRLLERPKREYVRDRVTSLVRRTKDGVRRARSAFSVRDRRETLEAVEQHIKSGANVNLSGTSLGVEGVNYPKRRLHRAARNARLEGHRRYIKDGSAGSL